MKKTITWIECKNCNDNLKWKHRCSNCYVGVSVKQEFCPRCSSKMKNINKS